MKKKLKILFVLNIIIGYSLLVRAKDVSSNSQISNPTDTCQSSIDSIPKRKQTIQGFVAASATVTSNHQVPLWMRSMQHGATPQSGVSASIFAGAYKNYNPQRQHKLLDWGARVNARGNVGNELEFYLIEAYAKARAGIFQVSAGRVKDFSGLVDSTLSTGAFSLSGNALGIPKIELSTPEFWEIPFSKKILAFKGSFAHGWFGERISSTKYTPFSTLEKFTTYYHQKTLFGRLGKPHWKIRLYAGFNDMVMWGSEKKINPEFELSQWKTYKYMILGKTYPLNESNSKVGNHVGSLDQAMEINLKKIQLFAYHQFYYETGALAKLANVKDGTWGLSLKNIATPENHFVWHKILFEFIYSKSQGGEIGGPNRPSAFEDYYNNFQYSEGWTYKTENIGNILFTSEKYIREDLPLPDSLHYISNNRLSAFHSAFDFNVGVWRLITKITLSKNFGHYQRSPKHRGKGTLIVYNEPPYFGEIFQFHGSLALSRPLKKGWEIDTAISSDQGKLLYNSFGWYLKLIKKW